ncbi:MAG: hypothetical protein H6Q89_1509 [Myxococcaceae bacterium]|nr:hypothetical protein [Myxococcaceae bacterium]
MTDWKPKLAPTANLLSLSLTNEEGFLVSRLDGLTTVTELAALVDQTPEQAHALLVRLVGEGAVVAPPAPAAGAVDSVAVDSAVVGSVAVDSAVVGSVVVDSVVVDSVAAKLAGAELAGVPAVVAEELAVDSEAGGDSGAIHLKLYREQLHGQSGDYRVRLAGFATGPLLSACCFDPLPSVIRALMENPRTGLEQARLIATHHRNAAGLEFLFGRPELLRDGQVQRMLFRNPQINEGQLRRITQTKRLLEVWKLSVSRESTTQTRSGLIKILRSRFPTASAEERVELIFTTEGRVLGSLAGLSVDGHTTALLCARTFASVMLVQSLARWSATPPALIAHLLKQPIVLRQPRLKTMLHQHPNAPPPPRT